MMRRHVSSHRISGHHSGFTLIDLAIAVGIVGILAAISITIYSSYTTRAQASDIVVKYDATRSTTGANIAGDTVVESCDEFLGRYAAGTIDSKHAAISYGFEAVSANGQTGYRPVMQVCAQSDRQGAQAVKVVRAAHDELAKNTRIEGGAVLLDSMASFAVPLTSADRAVCRTAPAAPSRGCGSASASPALQQAVAQAPATPAPATVQQAAQPQAAAQAFVCHDEYGPTCAQDFGDMLCTEDYVREMCKQYCGVCGGGNPPQAVAAPAATIPVTGPVAASTAITVPPGKGWAAHISDSTVLPKVVPNDPNTGRWFSGSSGWTFNMGDPNCGTNGYFRIPAPSSDPQTVTAPCNNGGSKTIPFVRS